MVKRKRGPTRNISLAKKKAAGQKLLVEISTDDNRIVGSDSSSFIAEGGCVVRKQATLQVTKWARIDANEREVLRKMVAGSFEINGNEGAERVIDAQLNKQCRNYRHKLHVEHFMKYPTLEEALKHPPEGMTKENWDYIGRYFASPEFQRLSDRNRKNRAKQNTPHTAGTKSFARIRHEKKKETGTLPGQIKLYEMTRFSRKKQAWVNEEAEQNHEKMKQLLSESQVEGAESKTEEEICAQVLGRKSKPTSSLYKEQYRVELDEVRKRAERAEQENNEIKQKNNEMELKMQEMEASQKRMDEMLKTLMEQMSNGGHMVFRP